MTKFRRFAVVTLGLAVLTGAIAGCALLTSKPAQTDEQKQAEAVAVGGAQLICPRVLKALQPGELSDLNAALQEVGNAAGSKAALEALLSSPKPYVGEIASVVNIAIGFIPALSQDVEVKVLVTKFTDTCSAILATKAICCQFIAKSGLAVPGCRYVSKASDCVSNDQTNVTVNPGKKCVLVGGTPAGTCQ